MKIKGKVKIFAMYAYIAIAYLPLNVITGEKSYMKLSNPS